jgi:hypothetical protein
MKRLCFLRLVCCYTFSIAIAPKRDIFTPGLTAATPAAAMMNLLASTWSSQPKPARPTSTFAHPQRRQHCNRLVCLEESVSIWAWPSRGGLVVLERATALDVEFLGLDPVRIARYRDEDQSREDELCQRLLQLGAKWFDSRERYGFVCDVAANDERSLAAIDEGEQLAPTVMERRWISVGVPSSGVGLWVAEYETMMRGYTSHDLPPEDALRVGLARTMDEKCEILEMMGAKFYENVEQYHGVVCLNAWKDKFSGEIGVSWFPTLD